MRYLAAGAFGLVLVLAGCRAEVGTMKDEGSLSAPPSEGMRGISLQNFRESATRWVMVADSASVFRSQKRVEAEWVVVDFFEDEEHVSKLTADRGILLQTTDDLEARGNVLVATDDGARLKTEVLFWNHSESRIHTDEYVEITRGEDVLTGYGLEADPGLDRVELKREVRGSLRGDPEDLVESTE